MPTIWNVVVGGSLANSKAITHPFAEILVIFRHEHRIPCLLSARLQLQHPQPAPHAQTRDEIRCRLVELCRRDAQHRTGQQTEQTEQHRQPVPRHRRTGNWRRKTTAHWPWPGKHRISQRHFSSLVDHWIKQWIKNKRRKKDEKKIRIFLKKNLKKINNFLFEFWKKINNFLFKFWKNKKK